MLNIVNSIKRKPVIKEMTIGEVVARWVLGWDEDFDPEVDGMAFKTESTTQRNFLYATHKTSDFDGVACTDGAWLIKSILDFSMPIIPEITLWEPTDGEDAGKYYLVTDGKQRMISCAGYMGLVRPTARKANEDDEAYAARLESERIDTQAALTPMLRNMDEKENEDGIVTPMVPVRWEDLTDEERSAFLNYPIRVTIYSGSSKEQADTFMRLGQTGIKLSDYESVKGCHFGTYLAEFEDYLHNKHLEFPHYIKDPTDITSLMSESDNRGIQSLLLLSLALGHGKLLERKTPEIVASIVKNPSEDFPRTLKSELHNHFDKDYQHFDEIVTMFAKLQSLQFGHKRAGTLILLAKHLVNLKYEAITQGTPIFNFSLLENWINNHRTKSEKLDGDAPGWCLNTWKTCIKGLAEGYDIDPQRSIPSKLVDEVYTRFWTGNNICPIDGCRKPISLNERSIDHIIPWSKGGKTEINNLQIVHKKCNSSKNNR